MDNTQNNTGLPPGYSPENVITNNTAGGSNAPSAGGLPPGYSPENIIPNNTISSTPTTSDELQTNPDDSFLNKVGKSVGGVAEGVGEGLYGTLAGGADIVNKLTGQKAGGITQSLHQLAGDQDQTHGTAQDIGRGMETIGEFLMGDEALKGLSVAERLTQVSKALKIIEGNGKLARALALGINVGKAGAELGPEERAAIQKSPVLARLVATGMDALRAGATQGLQTTVKTGGDVSKGAGEGGSMALGSAALGAPLSVVGGVLAKGAEAAKTAGELQKAAESAPTEAEANELLRQKVQKSEASQKEGEAAEKVAGAGSVAESAAQNAPTNQIITAQAQKAAQNAHDALSTEYETAANKVIKSLNDTTIDYHDSDIKKGVQDLLGESEKNKEYLPAKFKVPSPLTPGVQTWLKDNLEHYGEVVEKGEDGKPKWVPQPTPMTAEDLLDTAKQLKANIRKTSYLTPEGRADRDAFFKLLDDVHQSLADLAIKSGKPEAIDAINQMNDNYKEGIARFNHPDVKAILQGGAENRILSLLQGGKSVGDIQTIKKTIGPKAFSSLADSMAQRIAADSVDKTTGQFSFDNFFKNWNKIPADIRGEVFENSLKGGSLENAVNQIKGVNSREVVDTLQPLLEKGDVSKLVSNPEQINELQKIVSPEAMGEIGKTILQNQLREASTVLDKSGNPKIGAVDTDKFLNFINQFKDSPETINALFKPTPETADAYSKLLQDVHNVDHVKEMVKLGIIAPAIGATAGGVLHHSAISAIMGAMAAEGAGYFKTARVLLDRMANSPQTWATLRALGRVSESPVSNLGSRVVKAAAGKPVGNFLKQALGMTNTELGR